MCITSRNTEPSGFCPSGFLRCTKSYALFAIGNTHKRVKTSTHNISRCRVRAHPFGHSRSDPTRHTQSKVPILRSIVRKIGPYITPKILAGARRRLIPANDKHREYRGGYPKRVKRCSEYVQYNQHTLLDLTLTALVWLVLRHLPEPPKPRKHSRQHGPDQGHDHELPLHHIL